MTEQNEVRDFDTADALSQLAGAGDERPSNQGANRSNQGAPDALADLATQEPIRTQIVRESPSDQEKGAPAQDLETAEPVAPPKEQSDHRSDPPPSQPVEPRGLSSSSPSDPSPSVPKVAPIPIPLSDSVQSSRPRPEPLEPTRVEPTRASIQTPPAGEAIQQADLVARRQGAKPYWLLFVLARTLYFAAIILVAAAIIAMLMAWR